MSILIDETTPVVVQGMTGDKGTFHAKEAIEYGTNVVAGVTPGKGGGRHLDRPLFNTMKEAVKETGAKATITFEAPAFCSDAIMEAADAGVELICSITDGIPAQDMMRVKRYLMRYPKESRTMMVGPNCAGVISPGKAMLGIMPGHIYLQGKVGVISRSGTLGYEAAAQMKAAGVGITTSVGIGGDPINGTDFVDCLRLFQEDPGTDSVILIGEIGGAEEEQAAEFLATAKSPKPVVALIAGRHAPVRRRMGHAGTLSLFGSGGAQGKIQALKSAGVHIAENAATLGETMRRIASAKN